MSSTLPAVVEALRALAPHAGPLPPPPACDLARERLIATWGLSPFEIDLVTLAALPELHDGWGELFARLGAADRRPTLGLALRTLVPEAAQRTRAGTRLGGSAVVRAGMVRLDRPDLPYPDRPVRPSPAVAAFLRGERPDHLHDAGPVRRIGTEDGRTLLAARPSLQAVIARLTRGDEPLVVRLHPDDPDAADLARALAAHLGRGLVRIVDAGPGIEPVQDAALLAALGGEVVWLEGRPEVRRWLLDPEPPRGVLLLAPPAAARVELEDARALEPLPVPRATPPEMAAIWQHLVPEAEGRDLDPLANRTRLGLAEIRRAVVEARTEAEAAGEPVTVEALQRAVAAGRADPPSDLARIGRPAIRWDALVVPEQVQHQLAELRARIAHRMTVQYRWGMAAESGRGDGVVALLHGDSGVGKTFAAEVLASAFALPLVQVDPSRIVAPAAAVPDQRLEALIDAAEGFRAILLFDEADAVFGRRGGTAAAARGWQLLQRLERLEGVALLSTRHLHEMDDAVLRRLPIAIHLPRPTAALRRRLWERSIPDAARAVDLDLAGLATRFDLVGGEIRSAAVRAAYGAAAGGGRITQADALAAIRMEYLRTGRSFPDGF